MKTFILSVLLVVSFLSVAIKAQSYFEPVGNSIYNFLERLSINGVIDYHGEVKPIQRKEIAKYLIIAERKPYLLTGIDKEELGFYEQEYADEIDMITQKSRFHLPSSEILSSKRTGRFRLFSYRDSSFSMYLDPILGFEGGKSFGSSYTHRWNGASVFGYVNQDWSYGLRFVDNEEIGSTIDTTKDLTPVPGFNLTKKGKNSIQYDEVQTQINYSWKTGDLSVGKYDLNWGSGNGGQLILSNKAPSFPLIRFDFSPLSWLRFTYIHGWLHSGVIDSNTYRYTAVPGRPSYVNVDKFIAAHMLSFDIKDNLTFSIGESIIYSDRLEPIYLIPVMFFRLADHYLQKSGSNTGGNAQMFADVYYKNSDIKTKFYSTLFIDELSIQSLLKGGNLQAIGFTIGFQTDDPLIKNSSLILEYTRLNPFVYMNSDNAQLYTNYGYQLGDWIGSNGYQVYADYKQQFTRGLSVDLSLNYVIKGQKELPVQQYETPYPAFLYGPHKEYKTIKLQLSYEIIHEFYAKGYYQYSDIFDHEPLRTPAFMQGKKNSFGFSLSYGF